MQDEEDVVEITIGTAVSDLEIAKKEASDLAWEHATELARSTGVSLGSEDFEELFRKLSFRYEGNTEYLKFLLMTAMLTVRELLESNTLALPHNGDKISEAEVLELITNAARSLMASYMWLAAGYELTWPKNHEMPEVVNVSFYFSPDDIDIDEEV
jgi:hypothetical protein